MGPTLSHGIGNDILPSWRVKSPPPFHVGKLQKFSGFQAAQGTAQPTVLILDGNSELVRSDLIMRSDVPFV